MCGRVSVGRGFVDPSAGEVGVGSTADVGTLAPFSTSVRLSLSTCPFTWPLVIGPCVTPAPLVRLGGGVDTVGGSTTAETWASKSSPDGARRCPLGFAPSESRSAMYARVAGRIRAVLSSLQSELANDPLMQVHS
ncbi:hypothetical protein AG1IA_00914 [Rhizoctonia solani AG-1 IA]|uniref:Uncharacterized protein n=1 Tax=Thanatephorus cucumeris (strain AG1-IA) TaxID=983506 RepID=L8X7I2_THACA|nr:hypothetical protein AG1IA_00914 [Rhizoctonia solani AG-1 IA]